MTLNARDPEGSSPAQGDDTFLFEDERYERVYRRRKAALQQRQDISNDRLFLLSDNKPWQVFENGYSSRLHRRRLVFEHSWNFPALHQACVVGDREQVRALLSLPGVCVLERDTCGRIALHHAVITEHLKIAKRLLRRRDARLQVHVRDSSSRTALHYALEKMELLALHRREGYIVPALVTARMRAESKRYLQLWELADRMLEMFCRSVLEREWSMDGAGGESLKKLDFRCRGDAWDACLSGDLQRLETIVKVYGCSKCEWELRELKRTLLHEACENQQLEVVYFLISMMGVPVLAQDTSGCTALHCAARRGYLDVCQVLLGKSPVDRGDEKFQLNETAEELALLQDVRGRTALHWSLLGSSDAREKLLAAGCLAQSCPATLHVCDQDGMSPLHLAIWKEDIELVLQFISLGASVCGSFASVNYKMSKEKALWAPCGIFFQRHRHQKMPTANLAIVSMDNGSGTNISPSCRKNAPDWENVKHPVETVWYWTRQSGAHHSQSKDKETDTSSGDIEPVMTDEELGCRKYGGMCLRCKPPTEISTRTGSSLPNQYQHQLLSPLLLALRVCALKWGYGSNVGDQVAIVELLLLNGAPPDGVHDDDDASKQVNLWNLSALSEGVRASLRYPQLLPMLLQHGAQKINPDWIVRWCATVSSTNTKQIERILSQLIDLNSVATSTEFLTMLFHQKHFVTLHGVLRIWPQKANPMEDEVAVSNRVQDTFGGTPWKFIYESLKSRGKRRKKTGDVRVDIEHLELLRGVIQPAQDNIATDLCDCDTFDLFEYCIDTYLQQRKHDSKVTRESMEQHEHVVLFCIRILFRHWNKTEVDDQRIKAKAASWVGPTVMMGYFDCALVLLETLNRLGRCDILLDTVFERYASAVGARRDFELSHHREFLVLCVEKLLDIDAGPIDQVQRRRVSSHSSPVSSVRSIIHTCANNLPLALIKSCFDIVFPDGLVCVSPDKPNTFAALANIRVGAKTMYQWIVDHERIDSVRWLLDSLPKGLDRGSCWSKFIAASTVLPSNTNEEGSKTSPSFVENLFAVYTHQVQCHLSGSQSKDLLVNLMIRCAIPTDCVPLLTRLVFSCRGSKDLTTGGANELEKVTVALKEARVLHLIVRWNALQTAEFCLSGRCWGDSSGMNLVDWKQIFLAGIQERHEVDECTPLELCRLLGHNHMYNLLSTNLLNVSLSEAMISADTNTVESDESESARNSDIAEKLTERWQVGLLRSVIDINGNLTTNTTTFRGYQRHVSVQNRWLEAVTLNQVSILQAMALTRSPCTNPDPCACTFVLAAIKSGSLGALRWIIEENTSIVNHLSDLEGVECLNAAAKHPGNVYAEMTLLLLEHQLSPGRLSGDGMGVPLLHRAACFTNASVACRIMAILLGRSDCDVNALDAFGNTAVSYALAAGCLSNACFLMQHSKCRLEAEYEGQASFYYVLHLLPSFAPRIIVRELLVAKRDRAFLHCDAEDKTCGCKGYEQVEDDAALCSFCGHESASHRTVPLPSWFRDQYDTYVAARNSPRKRSHSSSDEGDSDGETSQHYLPQVDVASSEDEEIVLENGRGRLDVELLRRITVLRYDNMLHANGLTLVAAIEHTEDAAMSVDAEVANNPVATGSDHLGGDNCGLEALDATSEGEPVLEVTQDSMTMEELVPIDGGVLQQGKDQCVALNCEGIRSTRRDMKSNRRLTLAHCPCWLQQELSMVHSPRCLCQASAFVTTPTQLAHVALSRWLRCTAIVHVQQHESEGPTSLCSSAAVTESAIVALAAVQPAFEHWRLAARVPAGAVPKPLTPLPSLLRSVLFNWRHGKAFLAFQRWKNHHKSAEVAHQRLSTRLEQVTADMRRNRFLTLQLRQQQLQDSTQALSRLYKGGDQY